MISERNLKETANLAKKAKEVGCSGINRLEE